MEEKEPQEESENGFDSKLLPILREGVQVVKLIVFQELKKVFAGRYPLHADQENAMLAGTLINELFQTPNTDEKFLRFAASRAADIEAELAAMKETLAKLRPLLTDAIRVQFLCDSQESYENQEILRSAQTLGVLEVEREVPMPAKFIHLVSIVGQSYGILAAR